MLVNTVNRENTEKRNYFYKTICELNNIDPRYKVYRDNQYFDTHHFFLMELNWWKRLFGYNKCIASIDLNFKNTVYIKVELDGYIDFCKNVAKSFEDKGLSIVIFDNTLKAKETC